MFRVSNKDRRTLLASLWCLYCWLWIYFTLFSNASIANFEEVNTEWVPTNPLTTCDCLLHDLQFAKSELYDLSKKRRAEWKIIKKFEHNAQTSVPHIAFGITVYKVSKGSVFGLLFNIFLNNSFVFTAKI